MNRIHALFCFLAITALCGCGDSAARQQQPVNGGKDKPLLPRYRGGENEFRVDQYIEVAIVLQKEGKDKAIKMLEEGKMNGQELGEDGLFVLCRMLFVAKKGAEFRRPAIGAPLSFKIEGGMQDWPLEPIALVDGVPFCVVMGYSLGGKAERASYYFKYCCLESCDWSGYQFKTKTLVEKQAALKKVLTLTAPRRSAGGLRFL